MQDMSKFFLAKEAVVFRMEPNIKKQWTQRAEIISFRRKLATWSY